MPKGKHLTSEQHREIYEASLLGESRKDIAEAYGITASSVTRIVRNERRKAEDMAYRECVVAGNKKTGHLVSTRDPHRFDGTCVIAGKANSRTFTADNASAAAKLWREWCHELQAKQPKQVDEPARVDGPTKVEDPVEEPKPLVVETPKPKKMEIRMDDKVYVIWLNGDKPRLFGAYTSMEPALVEVDRLNEIASFLGSEPVFEVEELALRS